MMQTVSVAALVKVPPGQPPECRSKFFACSTSKVALSWIIGERMTGTAGPMPFNAAFPEEVPTGRIDPLLVADVPE